MYLTSTYLGRANPILRAQRYQCVTRTPELIEEVAKLIEQGIDGWYNREASEFIGADAEQYNAVHFRRLV